MFEENSNIDNLLDHTKEYFETRVDILKIEAADRVSAAASSFAIVLVMAFIGLFVLFFASAGFAWLIAKATGNTAIGLFSVAGFYLLAGIILYASREKWITIPVVNSILKQFSDDKQDQ